MDKTYKTKCESLAWWYYRT